MAAKSRRNKQTSISADADALFSNTTVRAIARKSLPPGYTVADLQQFLILLYGMFEETEAREVRVFDPFANERGKRITVARLADAIAQVIDRNTQQSA